MKLTKQSYQPLLVSLVGAAILVVGIGVSMLVMSPTSVVELSFGTVFESFEPDHANYLAGAILAYPVLYGISTLWAGTRLATYGRWLDRRLHGSLILGWSALLTAMFALQLESTLAPTTIALAVGAAVTGILCRSIARRDSFALAPLARTLPCGFIAASALIGALHIAGSAIGSMAGLALSAVLVGALLMFGGTLAQVVTQSRRANDRLFRRETLQRALIIQ